METQSVTLTEFKQNLGELVNRAAYGNLRIELVSRGKVKAALISVDDLRRLETLDQVNDRQFYIQQRRKALNEVRELRERLVMSDTSQDSIETMLDELREERTDELMGLR
ncbi:MAG TPA: type II toxin-antitoxin system prevent-host-death family antitoxin [Anaerolineae bacterium]|nr:type II toxin-antitoxin system prevent-host-death family antitoxin [Anaerolineae bacterium]HQI87491.1 type II toxin-antitoxin system prevent-host-death family antitoxin [Anaerolineae bacterium]